MPDSFGKRQRESGKAKKAAAREERRLARAQRDADREAGLIEAGTPIEASEPAALGLENEAEPRPKPDTSDASEEIELPTGTLAGQSWQPQPEADAAG